MLNRKEYGYPTYTGWCTEHWGTDENVISFEECNENSIAFLTHSAPASEAIHTLSILFPKVKLTFAWEENKVALMDDEVVLHYEVYRYGELAESKSAIAGKTHWQYNGSLKNRCTARPKKIMIMGKSLKEFLRRILRNRTLCLSNPASFEK